MIFCLRVSRPLTATRARRQYATRLLGNSSNQIDHFAWTAHRVLTTADPLVKCDITEEFCAKMTEKQSAFSLDTHKFDSILHTLHDMQRPARPDRPELIAPQKVGAAVKQSGRSQPVALMHGTAHIELNAIDSAWSTILQAAAMSEPIPGFGAEKVEVSALKELMLDFALVAADEARHFRACAQRLIELDSFYGDLPAQNHLWDMTLQTRNDLRARICMLQLCAEARGLDSGQRLVGKLISWNDKPSAAIMQMIVSEEVGHVKIGMKHFLRLCEATSTNPRELYQLLVRTYYGPLNVPFDVKARAEADMPPDWYQPLGRDVWQGESKKIS